MPIPKTGDPTIPSNNRPISLLSVLSKITEKVACTQLTAYLEKSALLNSSQYAYRPGHSTEDAVLATVERLIANTDRGHISSVTTIDLSKAFDCVDHDVLLSKLSWYGVTDIDWFRSYLSGRKQIVRGGQLTLPLSCGVPQGSILCPILFILFTNDLNNFITHGHLLTYADDTTHIDCTSPDGPGLLELKARLQQTISELQSWFGANSLKMNERKTHFMLVGTKQKLMKAADFHLEISGAVVHASKNIKILGVTVDSELSWNDHVSSVVRKCNCILISLYRCRHYFTPHVLKIIIQTYVFPYIRYCMCVWGGTTKNNMTKLQKIINFSARIVCNVKKYDHITSALISLEWPRIEVMAAHGDLLKLYRTLKEEGAPHDIKTMFVPRAAVSERQTRATDMGRLHLPNPRLAATRRAFSYRAAAAWNRLPPTTCGAPSVKAFKAML